MHNDLAADHLVVHPQTRELCGIIDFADQALGDPLLDLVGAYSWLGEGFVRRVVTHHPGLELGEGGWHTLRLLTASLALSWALDAQRKGEPVAPWIEWLEGRIAPMLRR